MMRRISLLIAFGWIVSVASAQTFRFAWLSDTHVGGTTGTEDLRASVRDINAQGGLQFVILSGDVTEYGSLQQLAIAKQLLDSLTIPYHIIPGNHDTKWSESGATDFPKLFGADRFVFDAGGIRFIGMHEGPLMKMGAGHWAPQDVLWLDSVLAAIPSPDVPVIFVTHYPLDESIDNCPEVLDRLKTVNTQAALVGHGHNNHRYTWEGIAGVMGRSNLRARDSVGGYTIVTVSADSILFAQRNTGVRTRAPWTSIVRHEHRPAPLPSSMKPDFSVNGKYPGVKPAWEVMTHWTIASTPAVANGMAIVGDASGAVYAFDLKTGAQRWIHRTGGAVYSTPNVSGETVVVASTDGSVSGLRVFDGLVRWTYKTTRPIVASPRCADGVAYIGSSDGTFRALDVASGRVVWEYHGVKGFVETRPLLYDGMVIFGAWDTHLYALDAKTGAERWIWTGNKSGTLLSPAACWPVAAHGTVFIVAPDRIMTAIDAATGKQLWRTANHQVRESIGLSEDGSRVYVRMMQDSIAAVAAEAAAPRDEWVVNAGFGYDINSGMLVEKEGTVYYATWGGLVLALDGRTGRTAWEHRIGVGLVNTLVPVDARHVLATDFDGRVTMLEIH